MILLDPLAPWFPSWVGYLGEPPLSGMAASTCAPDHDGTGHNDPRYDNADGMGPDDLREDNVPAQDAERHDFILNKISAALQ